MNPDDTSIPAARSPIADGARATTSADRSADQEVVTTRPSRVNQMTPVSLNNNELLMIRV